MSKTETPQEVIVKRATVELECKLTDAEFRDRAKRLAKVESEMSALDAKHESLKQTIKQETAALESTRAELSGVVDRGTEFRMVATEVRQDFAKGRVYHVRMDTGEVYTDRPMNPDERQRALPLPADKKQEVAH